MHSSGATAYGSNDKHFSSEHFESSTHEIGTVDQIFPPNIRSRCRMEGLRIPCDKNLNYLQVCRTAVCHRPSAGTRARQTGSPYFSLPPGLRRSRVSRADRDLPRHKNAGPGFSMKQSLVGVDEIIRTQMSLSSLENNTGSF